MLFEVHQQKLRIVAYSETTRGSMVLRPAPGGCMPETNWQSSGYLCSTNAGWWFIVSDDFTSLCCYILAGRSKSKSWMMILSKSPPRSYMNIPELLKIDIFPKKRSDPMMDINNFGPNSTSSAQWLSMRNFSSANGCWVPYRSLAVRLTNSKVKGFKWLQVASSGFKPMEHSNILKMASHDLGHGEVINENTKFFALQAIASWKFLNKASDKVVFVIIITIMHAWSGPKMRPVRFEMLSCQRRSHQRLVSQYQ